jgi:phosphoenolpyruvate carboxylase
MLRQSKLTVADEIENALSYYQATFLREIPRLYRDLERALPGHPVAPFLRMGHWIGGDRDGNPNVGAATLRHALSRQAEVALRFYLTEVHELGSELSMSGTLAPVSPEMAALAAASPDQNVHRADEPYRRALIGIYARLAATLQRLTGGPNSRQYWAPLVRVEYTPTGMVAARDEVTIKLIALDLSYRGALRSEKAGDYAFTLSGDMAADREAILQTLEDRRGMVLA